MKTLIDFLCNGTDTDLESFFHEVGMEAEVVARLASATVTLVKNLVQQGHLKVQLMWGGDTEVPEDDPRSVKYEDFPLAKDSQFEGTSVSFAADNGFPLVILSITREEGSFFNPYVIERDGKI